MPSFSIEMSSRVIKKAHSIPTYVQISVCWFFFHHSNAIHTKYSMWRMKHNLDDKIECLSCTHMLQRGISIRVLSTESVPWCAEANITRAAYFDAIRIKIENKKTSLKRFSVEWLKTVFSYSVNILHIICTDRIAWIFSTYVCIICTHSSQCLFHT